MEASRTREILSILELSRARNESLNSFLIKDRGLLSHNLVNWLSRDLKSWGKELPLISHENSSLPPCYLKFYPSLVSNLFLYDMDMS